MHSLLLILAIVSVGIVLAVAVLKDRREDAEDITIIYPDPGGDA